MSNPSRHQTAIRYTPRRRGPAPLITTALGLGLLMSLALAAAPAQAESPLEGRYQGRGDGRLDLQVFELGDGSGAHFVVAGTAIPDQCTGELRGLAKPGNSGVLVLIRRGSDSDETCPLTLRFGPDRRRVRMEEQGCSDFHGPACTFGGALNRR